MITKELVFIEMPRTGCTLFRNILCQLSHVYDPPEWGQHSNYEKMLNFCREIDLELPRTVVAFTRHPKTWYLSAWCYTSENVPDCRGISFKSFLESVSPEAENRHLLRRTLTEIWNYMGADAADYVGSFENLYTDIRYSIYQAMQGRIAHEDIRNLLAKAEVYRGSRLYPAWEPLSGYNPDRFWSDEMRGWVQEWDGEFMRRHGYVW